MVGDTDYDVLGAKDHGIPTIGVTWGYGEAAAMQAAGAVALAGTLRRPCTPICRPSPPSRRFPLYLPRKEPTLWQAMRPFFACRFGKIYRLLLDKAVKKGRTEEEVHQVTAWLTGYSPEFLLQAMDTDLTYGDFFRQGPHPNPNREKIKGVVCGVRVEAVEDPLMREMRYLDKLVDELAKGKAMEAVLRQNAR